MSFDTSRFSFHPWHDYFGVVMQQGRVQLDSDWNEWVAELGRRLQAGTMDTVGRAVVPRTTPEGFHILAPGGVLNIGVGRMYVDGLLAENHGKPPLAWNVNLAELTGSAPTPFLDQPYLHFNETNQPAPANIFNAPALTGGPHLVYLDVWQRELTHLQAPELIEKAVGVDTTGRLQTVWQVKVLTNVGNADCFTPDGELPAWAALTRPSGARLSNSTGLVTGDQNPCLAPPSAGYKGLENQLYRVEIHRGGPQASATFKWSRDNATVATGVQEIQAGNRLVVDSLGRDDVLGFHAGEWVEILDDWHELHGLPGRLHRIRPGDGVDAATRSIILETALPAGLFPVDGQGKTDPERHTRVRRWDQSGVVRRADGTDYHNINAASVSDGIPVPAAGTKLTLENCILIDFSLIAGSQFKAGDHWVFAARTSDGSIEPLVQAPPRGIHHHYARLAIVTLPGEPTDCRIFWPPEVSGDSCDCTVCVHAEAHNAGTATIQQAIDAVRARGGGTICLDVGTYLLRAPLNMANVRSLRMRGQGWRTVLQPAEAGGAIDIARGVGVAIENLSIAGIVSGGGTTAMIDIVDSLDVQLEHLTIAAGATADATSAAIGFSGLILSATVRDCVLVAEQAIVSISSENKYLLTANLRMVHNVLMCSQIGISLTGTSLHYGQLRIADNLALICAQAGIAVTGAALPAASVTIDGNILHVTGNGVIAGTDGLRIDNNEIVALAGKTVAHGIALVPGFDKGALDRVYVTGNRLRGQRGHGIAVRQRLGRAIFKSNSIENTVGGALVMDVGASADYLSIEGNQFANLGVGFNSEALPFFGVLLIAVKRADVVGNLFANVARQAVVSPLRVAIMAMASGELRVAGNRLFGIGPLASFNRRTIGIGVTPGFADVAVDDNTVARVETDADKVSVANWQAILIVGSLQGEVGQNQTSMAAPGIVMLPLKSGNAYLSAGKIDLLNAARGSVMVRGNRLHGHTSLIPTAEILVVQCCLFDQNDIRVTDGSSDGMLAGRILGDHASVANNRFAGSVDKMIFELFVAKTKYSVLGNLRTAPILVNGTPDNALPPPWNALNVAI
jgi:hypothetical protein